MTPKLSHILVGFALAVGLFGVMAMGLEKIRETQAAKAQTQADVAKGEAKAHADQAQAIPDHSLELARATQDVAGARAEVARLKRLLASKPGDAGAHSDGAGQADLPVVAPDHRDELIAAQDALVGSLNGKITVLESALADETSRSGQWKAAYEASQRQAMAQEAATRAWKDAVTASRWSGRVQGFAVGIATGYVAGKLR